MTVGKRYSDTGYPAYLTLAEAQALEPVAGEKITILSDDGGDFEAMTGAAFGTYTNNGGSFCGTQFVPSGGDGTTGWVRIGSELNVKYWGVWGDNATQVAARLNTMIQTLPTDALSNVRVEAGTYLIESTVHIDRPVLFKCDGQGEITLNANTSGTLGVTFRWDGANGGYMFVHSRQTMANMAAGTTTGELVVGGGIIGAVLKGQAKAASTYAACLYWMASTVEAELRVQIRQITWYGVVVDGGNGALSTRNKFDIHFVHGSQTATQVGGGMLFRAYNGYPSTQNTIERLWGLAYTGSGATLIETDNNIFWHIHIVTQSGGTANAIRFMDGTPPARNNVIWYQNGDVYAAANTYGNRILHLNSEGTKVVAATGAQIHYETIDYVSADVFKTHTYKMSDKLVIDASRFMYSGTALQGPTSVGGRFAAARLQNVNYGAISANIPVSYDLSTGKLNSLRILYTTDTNLTGNITVTVDLWVGAPGGNVATTTISEQQTFAAGTTKDILYERIITFTTPPTFNRDDTILLRLQRNANQLSDTFNTYMDVVGLELDYTSYGPNSAGSGPFAITPPYI